MTQTGGVFNTLNLSSQHRLGLKMDLPYQRMGHMEPLYKQFHSVDFGTDTGGNGMDVMIEPTKLTIYSRL